MLVGKINSYNYRPNFTRRLRENEKAEYNSAINEAKEYLGIENMSMILHGSCYPEGKYNTGIGSPFSKDALDIIKFEKLHGFNANQLGPNGEVTRGSISPYSGTVFAKNHLFIDLNELTTDKYCNILSKRTFNKLIIPTPITEMNYSYSEFFEAFEIYDIALKEAYHNFKQLVLLGNLQANDLNREYAEFKKTKGTEALEEALFQLLTHTYGTMDTSVWEKEVDRNLISRLKQRDPEAIERFNHLLSRSGDEINAFIFGQFIADKQIKENKELRSKEHFKYINDLLVGFSPSEEWIYRDVFLPDYKLGCPNGGKGNGPQLWEIPVLDPNKLFNEDGSLGPAGKLLEKKIESSFETGENIRIDHALGLVDPYIYKKSSVFISNGYLDRGRFYANNISQIPNLDPNGNYQKILEKILLPILKRHKLDPNTAVWENLGTGTDTFNKIYYGKLKLPGITQLEWSRGERSPRDNTALVGSHDSEPAVKMIQKDWVRNHNAWNIDYLAGYLNCDPERVKEREEFKQKIIKDPMEQVKAKFIELFTTSKNIQISFADFFGISQTYNMGGKELKDNWKLRLNKNYEDTYYKNLESDNPTALNLPEILRHAVQAKMDLEIVQDNKDHPEDTIINRNNLNSEMAPLLKTLEKYENILKEKTEEEEYDPNLDI